MGWLDFFFFLVKMHMKDVVGWKKVNDWIKKIEILLLDIFLCSLEISFLHIAALFWISGCRHQGSLLPSSLWLTLPIERSMVGHWRTRAQWMWKFYLAYAFLQGWNLTVSFFWKMQFLLRCCFPIAILFHSGYCSLILPLEV